jgi:hypothetical protein
MIRTAQRAPLLIAGVLSMAFGAWIGLLRLGWNLPFAWQDRLIAHGPLMVCGFLGTLISLERAVALASPWAYAAPIMIALGAVIVAIGPVGGSGALLITAGSAVMLAMLLIVWRRQPSLFLATMTLGAMMWFAGNVQWAAGAPIFRVVFFWLAFLVLTIAGERLELTRVLRHAPRVRTAFIAAMLTVLAGVIATRWSSDAGVRVVGVGLVTVTLWLTRYDVARRTMRQSGVTRFMAICLLAGYVWLGIAGLVAVISGVSTPGLVYDAVLHAAFIGFVMSMVFAHAPVIFPAVLGRPLAYRPAFYVHVAVLHASMVFRVVGDLVDALGRWRVWGGMLNAIALLLFVANTGHSLAMRRTIPPSLK